jgi:hypothetical protein
MADIRTISLNRDEIAVFAKAPKTIRDIENLSSNQDELATNVATILAAPLLSVSTTDGFSADRALAGSSDIQLTDAGAKGNLSLSLTTSGVSAGTYGSASKTVAVQVDAKGRIVLAAQYDLNTTNIAEGSKLFYTDARVRAAVGGSSTVTYSSGTGVFSITSGNIATALGYTPQAQDAYLDAISGTVPAADGTYASPTSITIANGIITAIS